MMSARESTARGPAPPVRSSKRVELQRFVEHVCSIEEDRKLSLREWVDLAEAWRITQVLRDCGGNRSAAARALGIGRRTLYAKMEKLGISPTWSVVEVPGNGASALKKS